LATHGIASALQVGGAQFIIASLTGCLLLGLLCRSRIGRILRDVRIGGRRIAFIAVLGVKNRYRQKHLAMRPGISKPAKGTMDTDGSLWMDAKRKLRRRNYAGRNSMLAAIRRGRHY